MRTYRIRSLSHKNIFSAVAPVAIGIALFLLAAGCNSQNNNAIQSTGNIYITPQAGKGISLIRARSETAVSYEPQLPSLKAEIPQSYVVSNVINDNLDNDSTVEQIVIFKNPVNDDRVRLLLIDYDRQRNSFIRAWEAETSATSTVSINIEFIDITQNGIDEMVVYGLNERGFYTLDIFSILFSSIEAVISLQLLESFISEFGIGIEQRPALLNGGADIPTPSVVFEEQFQTVVDNVESLSVQLVISQWDNFRSQFFSRTIPIVTNPEINQSFFQQFLQAHVDELLFFVDGLWVNDTLADDTILIVKYEEKLIDVFIEHRQITYQWRGQFKTFRNGFPAIQLTLFNQNIPTVSSRASITISSPDSIIIDLQDESAINLEYRRLQIVDSSEPPIYFDETFSLSGWYSGFNDKEEPFEIFFNNPQYIFKDGSMVTHGGYTLYTADSLLLELTELDDNLLIKNQQIYLVEYDQQQENRQVIRTIQLQPIILLFDQIINDDGAILHGTQIVAAIGR